MSRTEKFSATIGVISGYGGNQMLEEAKKYSVFDMGEAWQKAAAEVMNKTGIYVSGNINSSYSVYHTDWGCPVGGEPTYTITGSRNAEFCPNAEKWVEAVTMTTALVKEHFKQSTVTLEFSLVDQLYLTKDSIQIDSNKETDNIKKETSSKFKDDEMSL